MKLCKCKKFFAATQIAIMCSHRPLVDQNQTGSMVLGDMPSACITKHPMISDDLTLAEMKQRALLVALGLVYYVRLDSDYRERFAMELDKTILGVKFHTAFRQEV